MLLSQIQWLASGGGQEVGGVEPAEGGEEVGRAVVGDRATVEALRAGEVAKGVGE